MKRLNVVVTVCLAIGFAVFMAADSSIAAGTISVNNMEIFGNGHGPGDGTGNGGTGPGDGTGNGPGSCENLISDTSNDGILI